MAIFFSNKIPISNARRTYPKPDQTMSCGRIIVVTANLCGRPIHIVGFHADCGIGHARSIERLTQIIGDLPVGHEIILVSDHNHYINPTLDHSSPTRPAGATGALTANHAPSNDGGRSSYASLLKKHALQDTFRHLHLNKREYTRNHTAHGVTL